MHALGRREPGGQPWSGPRDDDSGTWFLNQAQTLSEAGLVSLYEELIGIAAPAGTTA
jgi:hypothetical protein